MPAFADAHFVFEAHLVGSLASFPNNQSSGKIVDAPVAQAANARALFEALQTQFQISPAPNNAVLVEKAEPPMPLEFPVLKISAAQLSRRVQLHDPAHPRCGDGRQLSLRNSRRWEGAGFHAQSGHDRLGQSLRLRDAAAVARR